MSRVFIPGYYGSFRCLADKCPDTCCKDWDIVVDDETLDFYRSSGDESLANALVTDDDGDVILDFNGGVCPHLTNGLCSVQTRYGADKLCETCRRFPRIEQDYTVFTEKMLTLACPEAARLMMIENGDFGFLFEEREVAGDSGYDNDYMMFLLCARKSSAAIVQNAASFDEMAAELFAFTKNAQRLIDEECFDKNALLLYDKNNYSLPDKAEIFDIHREMDVMDKRWLDSLEECRYEKMPSETEGEMKRLFLYYIARYYLTAIASFDVITTITRAYCAAIVCAALISREHAFYDSEARAVIYQKYSKEIEHSDENEELFWRLEE